VFGALAQGVKALRRDPALASRILGCSGDDQGQIFRAQDNVCVPYRRAT
jgi:hypothetical protein